MFDSWTIFPHNFLNVLGCPNSSITAETKSTDIFHCAFGLQASKFVQSTTLAASNQRLLTRLLDFIQ